MLTRAPKASLTEYTTNSSRRPISYTESVIPGPTDAQLASTDAAQSGVGSPAGEHRRGEDHEPMLHCPVCSQKLLARKCKLYCRQCGYYMSCADYI